MIYAKLHFQPIYSYIDTLCVRKENSSGTNIIFVYSQVLTIRKFEKSQFLIHNEVFTESRQILLKNV